jgi:hypothetical protein
MAACWFPFKDVLDALVTLRILPQFVAQIAAVVVLRRARPGIPLPFRMWLYPLPCTGGSPRLAVCVRLFRHFLEGRLVGLYGGGPHHRDIGLFVFFRPRRAAL